MLALNLAVRITHAILGRVMRKKLKETNRGPRPMRHIQLPKSVSTTA